MKKPFFKGLSGLTAAVMLAGMIPSELISAAETVPRGDVNHDGKITQADSDALSDLLKNSFGTIFVTEDNPDIASADVNSDNMLDAADLTMLNQYLAGNLKAFPTTFGGLIEDTVSITFSEGIAYAGGRMLIDVSFVDWTKDIYAYDVVIRVPEGFSIESVTPTDGGQYVEQGNSAKLYGCFENVESVRGKMATIELKADATLCGTYEILAEACNVYTSENTFYTTKKTTGKMIVEDLLSPAHLQASGISSGTVQLSWELPMEQNPINGYQIFRDGEKIGESTVTMYVDTGLTANTTYVYTVTAFDADGNQTKASLPLTVLTATPTISEILFPCNLISIDNSDITVKLSAKALVSEMKISLLSGEKTVLEDTVALKGTALSEIQHHLDISKLAAGSYTVLVDVTDTDGVTVSEQTTVSIAPNGPTAVTLTGYAGSGLAMLTWTVSDEADVFGYRVYRKTESETAYTFLAEVIGRNKTDYSDTLLKADTTYSYYVTALTDGKVEGAKSNAVNVIPTADEGLPQITFFSSLNGEWISGDFDISVNATDEGSIQKVAVLLCADGSDDWKEILSADGSECTWTLDSSEFADGVYQLKAMAYDTVGNASDGSNICQVMFDNTAPEQVKNVRLTAKQATTATIAWDDVADEDLSYFRVYVTKGNSVSTYTVSSELGLNLRSLTAMNTYSVSVAAVDKAGNIGPYSELFQFVTTADNTPPNITTFRCYNELITNGIRYTYYIYATDDSATSTYVIEYSQDKETWKRLTSSYKESYLYGTFYDLVDGPVYVRALVTDIYGNQTPLDMAPIAELIADVTAPAKVSSFYAKQTNGSITLAWSDPANDTVQGYTMQRIDKDSKLTNLFINNHYLEYRDDNVVAGETYRYVIWAYDLSGNAGEKTELTVTCTPDNESPVINEIDDVGSGYINKTNNCVSALLTDNMYIENMLSEYALDDSENFTALTATCTKVAEDHRSAVFKVVIPDSALTASSITLHLTAVDATGNKSDVTTLTYPIDNGFVKIESVKAVCDDNRVQLSFTCPDLNNCTSLIIERKIDDQKNTLFKSYVMNSARETTEFVELDKSLAVSGVYTYYVIATHKNGNVTTMATEPLQVFSIPKANLSYDPLMLLNKEYYFDATGSTNADEINSVVIDFGDGTLASATDVSKAKFKHAYSEVGTYNVTLTCKNKNEFSDTMAVTVKVEEERALAQMTVTVNKIGGGPASNASVYVDVGSENQAIYQTNSNGVVTFYAEPGTHEIGVLGNNLLPQTKTCEIYAGAENTELFTMTEDNLVKADFSIHRMSLSEIKAANIPVTSSANISMMKVNVNVVYQKGYEVLAFYYDSKTGNVYNNTGKGSDGSVYVFIPITSGSNNELRAVALLSIPTEVHMLKEMFKVDLTILNQASSDFVLQDSTVTLELPPGMTLMENAIGSSSATVSLGDIVGQASKKVSWIVRGDRSSDYILNASFGATLSTFDKYITQNFASPNIHVDGLNALSVTVNLDRNIRFNRLLVEMSVKNTSSNPQYMVSTDIKSVLSTVLVNESYLEIGSASVIPVQSRTIGTDGVLKILPTLTEQIQTLNPGETFSVMYSITGFSDRYYFTFMRAIEQALSYQTNNSRVRVQFENLALADKDSLFYGIPFDKNTQYMLVFRNKAGKSLSGVSVVVKDSSLQTVYTGVSDEKGRVILPRYESDKWFIIYADLEGYNTYRNYSFHYPSSTIMTHEYITMKADTNGMDLEPSSAAVYEGSVYKGNILNRSVSYIKGDSTTFCIEVGGAADAVKYELVQNGKVIARADVDEEGKAIFEDLSSYDFAQQKTISLKCYGETNDFITVSTQLCINPNPADSEEEIKEAARNSTMTDSNITAQLPAAWPYLGGKSVSFELNFFDKVGIEVEIDGYEFEVSVNGCIYSNDNGADKPKYKTVYRVQFAEAEFSIGLGAGLKGAFDPDTGDYTLTGQIYLTIGVSGEKGWKTETTSLDMLSFQTMIWIIPVNLTLGGSLSVNVGAQVDYSSKTKKTSVSMFATPEVEIRGTAAVGVKDVIGLGFYGAVSLEIPLEILPNLHRKQGETTVDGSIGLTGWIGPIEGSWELLSFNIATFRPSAQGEAAAETDENGMHQMTADELTYETKWNSAVDEDVALNALVTDTYGGAAPILCSDGKNVMLVWLTSDAERGTANAIHVVYSLYDPALRTWSAPKTVDGNLNGDYAPVLYAAADGIHIAYLESKEVYDADSKLDVESYLKEMQLVTAKFDAETGKFTNFVTFDINKDGGLAQNLQFAEDAEGNLKLYWQSNSSKAIVAMDETNYIACADITEDGVSEPVLVAEKLPLLTDFCCGKDADGKLMLAYVIDPDSNMADSSDVQLMLKALDGEATVLSTGNISNVSYSKLPDGTEGFVWMQDGAIYASADGKTAAPLFETDELMLTGEYAISGNRVLFLVRTDNGVALCSASYDAESKSMSSPIVLSNNPGEYYANLSQADTNGEIIVALLGTTPYNLGTDNVNYDINLYTGTLNEKTDLVLSGVSYDNSKAVTDGEFPISFAVFNNSAKPITTFSATLLDENGNVIGTQKYDTSLASGASETFDFATKLGSVDGAVTYQLRIDTEDTDLTPDDNIAAVDLTKTDLSLESDLLYLDDDTTQVTLIVSNNSNVPASAVIVAAPISTGEETFRFMGDEIEPHSSMIYTFDSSELLGDVYHDFVKLSVLSETEESILDNNTILVAMTNGGFGAYRTGDADFSGMVDVEDAVIALKMFAAQMLEDDTRFTGLQVQAADADRNGIVDTADAILILQYYANNMLFEDDVDVISFDEYLESLTKKEAESNE